MLTEKVWIAAPPERVWEVVADPSALPRWNPKVVGADRVTSLRAGDWFHVTYRMSGREQTMRAKVEVCDPPKQLELRMTGGRMPAGAYVREMYALAPSGGGTRLTQRIDFARSGIPWFWRAVMTLIHRIGQPTGTRYLVRLKEIVESRGA